MKQLQPCTFSAALVVAALVLVSALPRSFAQAATPSVVPPAISANGKSKAEEPIKLEAYTVTGSNIKRLEFEKVLPVTVLNEDLIDGREAASHGSLLSRYARFSRAASATRGRRTHPRGSSPVASEEPGELRIRDAVNS